MLMNVWVENPQGIVSLVVLVMTRCECSGNTITAQFRPLSLQVSLCDNEWFQIS